MNKENRILREVLLNDSNQYIIVLLYYLVRPYITVREDLFYLHRQKLVIRDVVEYAEGKIEATKSIVDG